MNIYIGFAIMILLSALWLMVFLRRPLKSNVVNLEKSNIALGKQKIAELQTDLQQGLIDDAVFVEAQNEITQTLAQELENSTDGMAVKNTTPIWLGAVLAFVIGISSITIYQSLLPATSTQAPPLATQPASLSLSNSVSKIQTHLLNNPNDANAWQILGLAYFELNQLDASLNAYEKSYQLNPKNPRLLVEYASTLAIKNNNTFSGRPIELVKQALELQPDAPDALYMAGLYAVSEQDFNLAKLLWEKALAGLAPNSPDSAVLTDVLDELSRLTSPDLTSSNVEKIQHTIKVKVDFSDEILASRSPQDYVMIYAKAATGRPMPIAIVKTKLKEFGGQVVLTDSNALLPSNLLSQANKVVIVARISKTGAAFKQAGDIEVVSQVVNVSDNPMVNLQIK